MMWYQISAIFRQNKRKLFVLALFLALFCQINPGKNGIAEAAAKTKKAAKPNLTVTLNKVVLKNARLQRDKSGRMKYSAAIKNKSSKGTIKRIEYTYSVMVKKPAAAVETGDVSEALTPSTVTLVAKQIKPGKTSKTVSCDGDESGQLSAMKLKTIRLYAGTALYTYDASTKKGTLSWAAKDKKAPVFDGWVKKNSFSGQDAYLVCFSDWKDKFDFAKYVSATDDRDGSVKIQVNTDQINWNKNGVYKVYYTARDKAGNTATSWAKVQVFVAGTTEQIADSVLNKIIRSGWSNEQKARAIYKYVKGHCSYIGTGSHANWRTAGLKGLRYQSGDCFTYYSTARLLLTRAGIPNIEVARYPSREGFRHWWNLTWIKNGWYHFDTTPRKRRAEFCLVTDAQLRGYSTGTTFQFQTEKYPKRAVKKISPDPKAKNS